MLKLGHKPLHPPNPVSHADGQFLMTVSLSSQTGLKVPADPEIPGLCVTASQTVLTFLPAPQLWNRHPGLHPVHRGGHSLLAPHHWRGLIVHPVPRSYPALKKEAEELREIDLGQLGFLKLGNTFQPKAVSVSPETLTTQNSFQRPKAISPPNPRPTTWKWLLHRGPKRLGLPHQSTSAEPTGRFPLSAVPIPFLHCSHPTPSPTLRFPGPWEWVETAASGGRNQDPSCSCVARSRPEHALTHACT